MTNFAPTTFTVNNLAPASTTSINGTSDNIISFDLVFNAGHTITTLQVFGIEAGGESAIFFRWRYIPQSRGNLNFNAVFRVDLSN